jgi:hypothetical protein
VKLKVFSAWSSAPWYNFPQVHLKEIFFACSTILASYYYQPQYQGTFQKIIPLLETQFPLVSQNLHLSIRRNSFEIEKLGLGMVVYSCNPSYLGSRGRRVMV